MDSITESLNSVESPLSELTRKERKFLLLTSFLGIFVSYAGVVPTKISALGIELAKTEQSAFMVMISLAITYFLFAFLIYGLKDFVLWRIEFQKRYETEVAKIQSMDFSDFDEIRRKYEFLGIKPMKWAYRFKKPVLWLNIVFEFVFPICVSIFTIASLLLNAYYK